mmetsp:Transcript_10079/g.22935  ORF Transcript_10079/g.22935 Transcript_10079/m.22935 type:complete len:207 (-) Transcript_10079:960-1580(-)
MERMALPPDDSASKRTGENDGDRSALGDRPTSLWSEPLTGPQEPGSTAAFRLGVRVGLMPASLWCFEAISHVWWTCSLKVLIFGSWASLSFWFVTDTSSRLRMLYASSGVLFDHISISPSLVYSLALWMHSIKHLRLSSGALRRTPSLSTSWKPVHASNCVQNLEQYDMSSRMRTDAPRNRRLMFPSMRLNASCSSFVRSPCGMHE